MESMSYSNKSLKRSLHGSYKGPELHSHVVNHEHSHIIPHKDHVHVISHMHPSHVHEHSHTHQNLYSKHVHVDRSSLKEHMRNSQIHRSISRSREASRSKSPPQLKGLTESAHVHRHSSHSHVGHMHNHNHPHPQSHSHLVKTQNFYPESRVNMDVAKRIAKRIFDKFDMNKSGAIESAEAHSMIQHAYFSINKNYVPNDQDCQDYIKTQDKDRDGKMTLSDIEKICIAYLCTSTDYSTHVVPNYVSEVDDSSR